jgi:hypothetical protein
MAAVEDWQVMHNVANPESDRELRIDVSSASALLYG